MKKIIFSFLVGFLFIASPASAQVGLGGPQITIDLDPRFPKPGEEVTAKINDYRGGAYGANITWVFDGKEATEAKNQRQAVFIAGENGVTQTIQATLQKTDGGYEVINTIITPLFLDIILEPQTRVPDFYLGRSLPSLGSTVNATAIVSNDSPVSNLVYTWSINNKVIEGGPLRGGNTVSFTIPRGNRHTLSLTVTNLNREVLAQRSISLPSVEPEVYFYENDPLFGIRHQPIVGSLALIGQSAAIKSEPYYLSSEIYNNPYFHQWTIDGVRVSNQNNPYEVTIERNQESGIANVEFEVRDNIQVLQAADGQTQITF